MAVHPLWGAAEQVHCPAAPALQISADRLATTHACVLQACKFVDGMAIDVSTLGKDTLINCAKTAMSSKIVGADDEFFSRLVVDAVTAVKTSGQPLAQVSPAACHVLGYCLQQTCRN